MPARRRPPEDSGRPTPREALAKATAAAGPRVAKAVEAAGPKVEKAATTAGKLLGTLRDRAKETAKGFTDGYTGGEPAGSSDEPGGNSQRRRPKPGPR